MITPNLSAQIFEAPSLSMVNHAQALKKRIESMEAQVSTQPKGGLIDLLTELFPQREEMSIDENGIAHVHLFGPVGMDLTDIEKAFGCTDYLDLREDFETAFVAGARGVFLYGWSPGGGVAGCAETAEIIKDMARRIPVFSFSEIGFYSAGTWLTAGASVCWGTRSGSFGNVGVIIPMWDTEGFWTAEGFKFDPIKNDGATLKDLGFSPKMSDDHRAFLQESVNTTAATFQGWVAENRKLTDPAKVWTAGWWDGRECLRLGLLDALGSKQDAYDTLLGRIR